MPKQPEPEFTLNGLLFNQAALDALKSTILPELGSLHTAFELKEGTFFVPLERDVMEALRNQAFEGESPSDTVIRLIAKLKGLN